VARVLAALAVLASLVAVVGCGGDDSEPAAAGELLALRDGGALVGIDTSTGERRFALPPGHLSADGRRYVAAERHAGATALLRFDARTGRRLARTTLRGEWRLGSVSADGRIAALSAHAGGTTRVALVEAGAGTRTIRLDGAYEIDAVDSEGRSLFLIERLGEERYALRLYDLAAGRLHDGSIRPKNEDEEMVGVAGTQLGTPDGAWLLTLYVNTEHNEAFVHALNLRERFALCLDLPSEGAPVAALRGYALALPGSADEVYAANPALGVAARVGLRELGSVQRIELGLRTPEPGVAAVSADGRMLWVAAGRTLAGVDTASYEHVGPVRLAASVESLAFGRNGGLLAVGPEGVTTLDPHTGLEPGA
jgi:hypothetical protein